MRALSGGGAAELILNTPNTTGGGAGGAGAPAPAIPGLPADAVVEVPCRVTPDGVAPLPQERPAPEQLALLRQVKDVERLVVAATSRDTGSTGKGRREAALAAFAGHPLVGSADLADKLLAGYEAAFPELKELWRGKP